MTTPSNDALVEIAILDYRLAQQAAIHGLTDLFIEASRISRETAGKAARAFRVTHWRPASDERDVEVSFDTHAALPVRPAVIIAPPTLRGPPALAASAPFAGWLKKEHDAGTTLCSVCGGTFLLADTGLLHNRRATTHWGYAAELMKRHPDIEVDGDKVIVDDGDIITAGGIMAWSDLGLKLIDRYLGPTVMLTTAKFFLIDTAGREQRFYSSFSPKMQHGDAAVLKVQHWLQKDGLRKATLASMAALAGLEQRTFLRRFRKATELNPTDYCQRLRVGKARELLELTRRTIDQVAYDVGYEDASSFRKVFHKVVGLRPGDYRKRFAPTPSTQADQ